jgi:hypothetical protein
MTAHDLDRIRFVSRHFRALQGLRLRVPFGLFLVARTLWPDHQLSVRQVLLVLALPAAAGILAWRAKSYYDDHLGHVEPPRVNPLGPRAQLAVAVGALLLWTSFLILIFALPSAFDRHSAGSAAAAPHNATAAVLELLAWSGIFFGTWIVRGRSFLQSHYLFLGVLFLALALPEHASGLAFLGALSVRPAGIVEGAALALGGLLDHWLLVHTMSALASHTAALTGAAPAARR